MAISSNGVGIRPGVCTSTTRPVSPYEGQSIYQTDTDTVLFWDGSTWVAPYATTAALNLKANIASPTFTGTTTGSDFYANTGKFIANRDGLTGGSTAGGMDFRINNNTYAQMFMTDTNELRITGARANFDGIVRTPSRPAFRYHGWTMTTSGMQGGTAPLNVGGNLSIGSGGTYTRFTAPIAGLYFFGASCLIETGAGRVEFMFTKNGSNTFDGYDTYAMNDFGDSPGGYVDVVGSYIFYLAAGDFIGMTPPVPGTLHANMTRGDRMFYGYLIG